MISQQSNTKGNDIDGKQQRTSRWNEESFITSVYVCQSLGQSPAWA
ncbi:hypothetical protein M153_3040005162 [Pseudoloma neurophilia]|uniref:Uncharacterized protein n=1 Tax=Pseudoloma neurophilia TaxID=146866 RepID=A0A0R0M4E7_9MICR|nr:hypothetical protein M153_3040005162 [Pseudoloma neurophilia]